MTNKMLFKSGNKVRLINQLIEAHYAIYGRNPDTWIVRQWGVMNERALQAKLTRLQGAVKDENN